MEVQEMNRSSISIVAKILAEKNGMTISEAEAFVKRMFDVANAVMQADKQVKIRWLGTFKVMPVKDRESVDVNTGERIIIGGRDKITFTPDNILKEIVNKPFAQFETVVVNDGVDFSEIDRKFAFESKEEASSASDEQPSANLSNPLPVEEVKSIPLVAGQPASVEKEKEVPVAHPLAKQPVQATSVVQEPEPSVVEESSKLAVETPPVLEKAAEPNPETIAPAPQSEQAIPASETKNIVEEEDRGDDSDSGGKHYFMLPRYVMYVAVILIVALIGGIGWFAFNYGKMQAQRNNLAMQLDEMQKARLVKDSIAQAQKNDLRIKVLQDSARLAQAAEVVNDVDEQETLEETKPKAESQKASEYDADPRVRTGAYRILGVGQTIVAKSGQTLSRISNLYLGPGMECYIEAVNKGVVDVKAGQKINIPKLELKKKK